ncbi:translation initiation factor IF-3 [Candidatus Gracilibacteria bacterium]|nr:translation initiation factor IF-3 [candidate division SR1 bacterium]MBF0981687.1 translation initiation factor IF-3 [Candidatus Gracilibacteria bacterium]
MEQKTFKPAGNNQNFGGQKKVLGGQNRSDKTMTANFKAKMIYVNDQIKAPNIMIIDDEKNNLGTFPRRVALEMASEKGLDLVQLVYDAEKMLSTVRLTDYGKYMYQKGKEEKERRKSQKGKDMKELKVSYAIGDNDLQLKVKKAQEILQEGDNVKFSIRLKGRERMYEDKAVQKLKMIQDALLDFGKSQYDTPKKEANGYSIILFSK